MSGHMGYFDLELKTALLFTIAGAIVGYISFLVNNSLYALAVAIVVYIVIQTSVKNFIKIKKDRKWWAGNAAILYILIWFVVWTLLFNTVVL